MIEIDHYYSLGPDWQKEVAEKFNAKYISEKILLMPESCGKGSMYFTEVIPGVSVTLLDIVVSEKVKLNRRKSEQNLYILQYDLSEDGNQLEINKKKYELGDENNLGLALIDSQIPSTFIPVVNKKVFTLRIIVDKKMLNLHIRDESNTQKIKKNLLYYNYIDSDSKILIHSLKDCSPFDVGFEAFIKGITLKILANFINFYLNPKELAFKIIRAETDALSKTIDYLLNNLQYQFPHIVFLAEMAGMSVSKYKLLFNKTYKIPPRQYFIQEKVKYAYKLLTSQKFNSMNEIILYLNYSKAKYFIEQYEEYFNRSPYNDFVTIKATP